MNEAEAREEAVEACRRVNLVFPDGYSAHPEQATWRPHGWLVAVRHPGQRFRASISTTGHYWSVHLTSGRVSGIDATTPEEAAEALVNAVEEDRRSIPSLAPVVVPLASMLPPIPARRGGMMYGGRDAG